MLKSPDNCNITVPKTLHGFLSFTYRSKRMLDCSVTPVSMMGHVPAGSSCVSQHPLRAVQARPWGVITIICCHGNFEGLWLSRFWFGSGTSLPLSRESPLPSCLSELNAQRAFPATSWLFPGGGATVGACFCSPTGCRTVSDDAAAVVAAAVVVAVCIPQCFAVEC